MPRKARLDAPGTLYNVIIRGIERRHIVDDDEDRENFVSHLGLLAAETETGICARTLMSNVLSLDINSFLEMGLISGIYFKQLCESF
jgi:hypothetical protein